MKIDQSIYRALDNGGLTIERFLESFGPAFDYIEGTVLADAADLALAAGFADADVKQMIDEEAQRLRAKRPARLETIRQMIECRATNLQ